MTRLAFRHPLYGLLHALGSGFGAFRLIDPENVFAPAARAEFPKDLGSHFVFLERPREVAWHGWNLRGLLAPPRNGLGALAGFDQIRGMAHVTQHGFIRGQVGEAREVSKRAQGILRRQTVFGDELLHFGSPEAESAVRLEGRQVSQDDALLYEEGQTPLQGL